MNFALNCQTNSVLRRDIEDLVRYRIMFCHAMDARLTDSDYAKYKTDVEGIILRIARFCNIENEMRQKLNDASQRPLDASNSMQYQSTFEQRMNEKKIEEVLLKINQLEQKLPRQNERMPRRLNTLEGKSGEDGKFYYEGKKWKVPQGFKVDKNKLRKDKQ
ncbi:unnamed protein product [Mytilus edulis]|uniref:Uncharacterized protein n=1 Tax=Mytilus edulis TaxID=6550 RepID=A0A8S3S987_MYTED|nr:unnamed protein product [Mytilus edulis]